MRRMAIGAAVATAGSAPDRSQTAVVVVAPVWSCMSDGPPPMTMTRWPWAGGSSTLADWLRLPASMRTPLTWTAVLVARFQTLGRTPLLPPYWPPL
jgi:hypothetical protein